MNTRKIINDWTYATLTQLPGFQNKVARVVPFSLAGGAAYPVITYQYQNFRDVEWGNGNTALTEATILVKVWDKDAGFTAIDAALDALPGLFGSQEGTTYEGHVIEYVRRQAMRDDFEAAEGSYYCAGIFEFTVGVRWP